MVVDFSCMNEKSTTIMVKAGWCTIMVKAGW
jgi:hypothetical protein